LKPVEEFSLPMQRILVTGASGFVGRHCLPRLVASGWQVHAVTSQPTLQSGDGVTWHHANLLDRADTERMMRQAQPSHLLHLAWYTTPGRFWHDERNLHWLDASLSLLKAFHHAGGSRVVMTGTCAEYDATGGVCHETSTPLRPNTTYGRCKHALQVYADAYCHAYQLNFAWARLFYMYGPEAHAQRFPGPIISALRRGEPAPCSHGNQVRDYLYIDDAAAALTQLVMSDLEGPINVASGFPIPLAMILQGVARRLDGNHLLQWGQVPTGENEPPVLAADTRRLNEELGWQPEVRLDDGLTRLVDWWKRRQDDESD
jgi:nucleoside-diphosphate-sugar epimerase